MFINYSTGIQSCGDNFIIGHTKLELKNRINDFISTDYNQEELKKKFNIGTNYARLILKNKINIKNKKLNFLKINYRVLSKRWTIFDTNLLGAARYNFMQHIIEKDNIALTVPRNFRIGNNYSHFFVVNNITDKNYMCGSSTYIFPIYIYSNKNFQRISNLNTNKIKLLFTNKKQNTKQNFSSIDIFDYICKLT